MLYQPANSYNSYFFNMSNEQTGNLIISIYIVTCSMLIAENEDTAQLISEQNGSAIKHSIVAYEKVVDSILDSTITMEDFRQMQRMQGKILELSVASTRFASKSAVIKEAFQRRVEELNEFTTCVTDINAFWQTCEGFFPEGWSLLFAVMQHFYMNFCFAPIVSI